MAYEIYTKLTTLYLAELGRLETALVNAENLMMKTEYNSGVMVEVITAKARLDYFNEFMKGVLEYVKMFDN